MPTLDEDRFPPRVYWAVAIAAVFWMGVLYWLTVTFNLTETGS